MICLASSHNFAFVSTLGPTIPEATSAVRIMSAPPHQSQQSGPPFNDGSTNTNYTNNNGCMFNLNGGGILNNLQITSNNSYQHPVNEPTTDGESVGEKWPDANDGVAASDCRRKI